MRAKQTLLLVAVVLTAYACAPVAWAGDIVSSIEPQGNSFMSRDRVLLGFGVRIGDELTPEGHDVPWGTGAGNTAALIKAIAEQGVTPTLFGLEFSHDFADNEPECAACIEFFDRLAREGESSD